MLIRFLCFFLFFFNVNSLITALDSVTAWKWCHNSETCLIGCNVGGVGLCLVLLPRWRQAEVWSRPLPSGGSSAAAPFCSSDGNRILESHWETRTSCQHMITLSRSLFFGIPPVFVHMRAEVPDLCQWLLTVVPWHVKVLCSILMSINHYHIEPGVWTSSWKYCPALENKINVWLFTDKTQSCVQAWQSDTLWSFRAAALPVMAAGGWGGAFWGNLNIAL